MAEIAPSGGGGPNRLFIVIAIGLGALLFLGLIGLGGFLLFQNISRTASVSPTARAVTPTPIRVLVSTPTALATDVATPTLVLIAVASPTGGATSTQPLVTATVGVTTTGTVTGTITGTPTGPLPKTGVGEDLLLLAGGLVLVLVIFAARRARASRPA